ncbi:hypothetical protein ACXGQW_10935 [Wenyingzhuangia sp. IMCC45533]
MKITCEEATTICTKTQYGEATLVEKIKLNMHFMYCKVCRLFTKQNAQLTGMCASIKPKNEGFSMSEADKLRLKEQIKEFEQ